MKQDRLLEDYLTCQDRLFTVTLSEAREIIGRFHEEMQRGLSGGKSSLRMIPSFVSRPRGTEQGRFLALDLGGTNIRVLSVTLDGRGTAEAEAVSRFVIPGGVMRGDGDALFDFIARCISEFFEEHDLAGGRCHDLAFTFSFPVAQTSVAAGTLLTWTKGFTAAGVVGRDVVSLLSSALRRRKMKSVGVAALANDTVGTLVAGSYADPACDMGVILGTGTNACYPERLDRITKCPETGPAGEMIVNMEWGNFDKLRMNAHDETLDRTTLNPGRQRLEKMVSGMYLGELARRLVLESRTRGLILAGMDISPLSREYALTPEHLARTAQGGEFFSEFGLNQVTDRDRQAVAHLCRFVSRRAARIAGTAIAAVVTWMDAGLDGEHAVAVDGSLFEKYPGFRENMMEVIKELFGARAGRIRLVQTRDGSGIGAAIIAAVAVKTRERQPVKSLL